MADSTDAGKGPDIPRPVKPAVPPFRGPGMGGPAPLRPRDPNSRLTRPPFIPPVIPGRKPLTAPAAPARPNPVAPVAAASVPDIAVPAVRAEELVEAIRPMSSSTTTPAPTAATSDAELSPSESGFPRLDQLQTPAWAAPETAFASPAASDQDANSSADAAEYGTLLPFVDPAPFVGTRESAPSESAEPSGNSVSPNADFGFPVADAIGTSSAAMPEPSVVAASHEPSPVAASHEPSAVAASHPLARTLSELARQIDDGDLEVATFEEGMSPEAALAATLAAMLKRAR